MAEVILMPTSGGMFSNVRNCGNESFSCYKNKETNIVRPFEPNPRSCARTIIHYSFIVLIILLLSSINLILCSETLREKRSLSPRQRHATELKRKTRRSMSSVAPHHRIRAGRARLPPGQPPGTRAGIILLCVSTCVFVETLSVEGRGCIHLDVRGIHDRIEKLLEDHLELRAARVVSRAVAGVQPRRRVAILPEGRCNAREAVLLEGTVAVVATRRGANCIDPGLCCKRDSMTMTIVSVADGASLCISSLARGGPLPFEP